MKNSYIIAIFLASCTVAAAKPTLSGPTLSSGGVSNITYIATNIDAATIGAAGTLSNDTTGNAASATGSLASTNPAAEIGVTLIVGGTNYYFGNDATSLTNATENYMAKYQSMGGTIKMGLGTFDGKGKGYNFSNSLSFIGVAMPSWKQLTVDSNTAANNTGYFIPGNCTIITNMSWSILPGCSNILYKDFGIERDAGNAIGWVLFDTNYVGCKIENVAIAANTAAASSHSCEMSGSGLDVNNLRVYNIAGHGPTFKGASNVVFKNIYAYIPGKNDQEAFLIKAGSYSGVGTKGGIHQLTGSGVHVEAGKNATPSTAFFIYNADSNSILEHVALTDMKTTGGGLFSSAFTIQSQPTCSYSFVQIGNVYCDNDAQVVFNMSGAFINAAYVPNGPFSNCIIANVFVPHPQETGVDIAENSGTWADITKVFAIHVNYIGTNCYGMFTNSAARWTPYRRIAPDGVQFSP